MDIWLRSIARAGGIEVPAEIEILPARPARGRGTLAAALAAGRAALARRLEAWGRALASRQAPRRRNAIPAS